MRTKTARENRERRVALLKNGPVDHMYIAPIDDKVYRNRVWTYALRNSNRSGFLKDIVKKVLSGKRLTDAQFFVIERIRRNALERKEMKRLDFRNKGLEKANKEEPGI